MKMIVSGIVPSVFLLIFFSTYTDAKSIDKVRTKRAPGIQHPRLGRRSEAVPFDINKRVLQHPRLGGKRSAPLPLEDINLEQLDPEVREQFLRIFMELVSDIADSRRREEIMQNFFAYPRQGRASYLHYPRMGRRSSWDSIDDLSGSDSRMCCSKGIKAEYTLNDDPVMSCKAERCCDGLVEKTSFSQMAKGLALVVECAAQQDMAYGSSQVVNES